MKTEANQPVNALPKYVNKKMAAGHYPEYNVYTPTFGLTKREYFAAMAMQGICAEFDSDIAAKIAVKQADALITALNAEQ